MTTWFRRLLSRLHPRSETSTTNGRWHRVRTAQVEEMEARIVLAADLLHVGSVYVEEDLGSDLHGDMLQISFTGGADGTQLTRLVIDGDRDHNGFSLNDIFFDTLATGFGADGSFELTPISYVGIDNFTWHVVDGSTQLVLEFEGFDAGEKFVFSIDVDEVQEYDPGETNQQHANEGIDPITSGVEFQGTELTATFVAPHYYEVTANGEFRNRYDEALLASGLNLPEDNADGKRDRSAGGFAQAQQQPLPVSISGTVYVELDLDRVQDANERGLAGVTLQLWELTDGGYRSTSHTTTTDAQGNYRFGTELGILPGTYQVREVQPTGYFSVAALPGTVDGVVTGRAAANNPDILTAIAIPLGDQHAVDYDFAEAQPAAISGYVYHDRDDDGRRDAGEEGIAGITITVMPIDTVAQQSQITVTTNASGFYEVTGLAPGTYRVVQPNQPADYFDGKDSAGTVAGVRSGTATNPGDAIEDISLGGGAVGQEYNFGELAPVAIHGRVQLSTPDGDCFSEDIEHEPIAGALVRLLDASGIVVAETRSDAQGEYWFRDLHPGIYSVQEVTPEGLIDGGAQAGTVAGRPVGNAISQGTIAQIELGSGQVAIDYLFCEHRPASLSGFVYHDRDDDGQKENGETGIAGVRVQLVDANGVRVAEQITNSAGRYQFEQLRAGLYSIVEVHPSDWVDGLDTAGRIGGTFVGRAINPGDRIRDIQLRWGDQGTDYNFGEILYASIQGRVHLATVDGDCFSESVQHDPVVGALVVLLDANGQELTRTTTDNNGEYSFTGLRPGNYTVVEHTPDGLFDGGAKAGTVDGAAQGLVVDAGRIQDIALLSGQAGENYEFCELPPSELAGYVYHDRDDDGRRETGEEGIGNVLVILRDSGGNVVDQQRTDTRGYYRFQNLRAGDYSVYEQQPTDWIDGKDQVGTVNGSRSGRVDQNADTINQIQLGWRSTGINYNFGEIQTASISGRVHLALTEEDCYDANGDSQPVVGAIVRLFDTEGALLAETTTDANGEYTFTELRPGTYTVVELTPEGLFDGAAHPGSINGEMRGSAEGGGTIRDILLTSGEAGIDYDFCEHPPAIIAGHVYHDINQNGLRDSGEQPVVGVEVLLRDATGNIVQRTLTNNRGEYAFQGLRAGTYSITEVQPSGWLDGLDQAGQINGSTVGEAENPGDRIRDINLKYGDSGTNYDFGELLPGSITGIVHSEINEVNCVYEEELGEQLLAGVRIDLLDSSGQVVASTLTDSAGRYTFSGLRPGTYTVREQQPADYFDGRVKAGSAGGNTTVANEISSILVGSGTVLTDYNFCEATPVSLAGYVFIDGDAVVLQQGESLPERIADVRDGQRSVDDRPLSGVALVLREGINARDLTSDYALPGLYRGGFVVVTDANGYYEFSGLRPGTYAVYQAQPEDLIDGVDTPGTSSGYVFNPGEPINQIVRRQLEIDPRNDAIVQVSLKPGARSLENNFSEVEVQSPVIVIPPVTPPPVTRLPNIPPPVFAAPAAIEPFRPPFKRPRYDVFATGGVPGNTWHLSVIDAGQPRGDGVVVTNPDSIWFAAMDLPAAKLERANQGEWLFTTEYVGPNQTPSQQLSLGLVGAIPVAGDFNGDGFDEVGIFYQGHWFIDINGNGIWDAQDLWAKLGGSLDLPVTGDWDGDGKDDIGIYGRTWLGDPRAMAAEPGLPDQDNPPTGQQKNVPPDEDQAPDRRRLMQLTSKGPMRADVIDHVFHYGVQGDFPVVGDWNGDGIPAIGVFRDGRWRLDMDGDGKWSDADRYVDLGQRGDIPVVGDFNGDGVDELGFYRQGKFYLDTNRNGRIDDSDAVIELGQTGDFPVVGDWNGDGKDEVAVYRDTEAVREARAE